MDLSKYENQWKKLIRPKGIEVDEESEDGTYGRFIIEPLERGYGVTLGNSLRRVLLSSLEGAAITLVRIEGCLHEYSSLPGVREDVTEIILNLKGVRFKMYTDEPQRVKIEVKGEKEVRAADIICTQAVEVVNPDHYIATVEKDGLLKMEMIVKKGRGYVPAERNKDETMPIGTIAIDSIFTPIRKVNYTVTPTRVGHITDYDRLILEVWSDGTIKPREAVGIAARILQEQLKIFTEFEEEKAERVQKVTFLEAEKEDLEEILQKSVEELEVSARSINALKSIGIKYIGDLVNKTEQELLQARNLGKKSLEEIKVALQKFGLSLEMGIEFKRKEEGKNET